MDEVKKILVPNSEILGEVSRLLDEGRLVTISTKGASMMPFIHTDVDSVTLKKFPDAMVGDIALAYLPSKRYVLHRIIRIEGDNVTLKGDGNLYGTEECTVQDIRGTVVKIIRPSGKEIEVLSHGFGRISRFWRGLPAIVRRVFLAIYRRIIL
ncbi:MAG: S24/S26 family peptidase [Bacteroidales bacterium]|nr:S24/S26 family peptidase [Bacteroidales bacterium]